MWVLGGSIRRSKNIAAAKNATAFKLLAVHICELCRRLVGSTKTLPAQTPPQCSVRLAPNENILGGFLGAYRQVTDLMRHLTSSRINGNRG